MESIALKQLFSLISIFVLKWPIFGVRPGSQSIVGSRFFAGQMPFPSLDQ